MSQLVPADKQSLERQQPTISVGHQLLSVIEKNPAMGAENVKALLDGIERVTKWEAEREFIAAFSRLKFPPIAKTKKGHSAKYAPWEDVQAIIDPILAAEGFTLTFSSGEANAKGEVPTFGKLAHVAGHSELGVIWLPPDGVATKSGGMNMNALQAIGSTTSYGMRYCAKLMLNLRFVGEDDDGMAGKGFISRAQEQMLREAIMKTYSNESKLLEVYGVKALADLPAANWPGIKSQLSAKYRTNAAAQGMDQAEIERSIKALWGDR